MVITSWPSHLLITPLDVATSNISVKQMDVDWNKCRRFGGGTAAGVCICVETSGGGGAWLQLLTMGS